MFPDLQPGKHLLLDNFALADTYRLRRTVHQPRRDPAGPVLSATEPWEGGAVFFNSVSYEPQRRLWQQWYVVFDAHAHEQRRQLGQSKHGNVGAPQAFSLCYAQSVDGVHWEKPNLGLFGATNICFKGYSDVNSASVLFRPDAPPQRRYLFANCEWRSMDTGGMYIASSADGIHWSYPEGDAPVIHGESDCINSLVWNEQRGVYMLYLRAWHSAGVGAIKGWVGGPGAESVAKRVKNTRRRVAYSESADLTHWSEPQIILSPDELDPNDFYGLGVFPYAGLYLGQVWVYDDDERETMHVELAWSRDGVHWERHPQRPVFIGLGEKGEPDAYMVQPAHQPVVLADGIYFFICARGGVPHDTGIARQPCVIHRARLRPDGFVSRDADRRLGALITRPFTLGNSAITINAATQGSGQIVAELVEPYWREPEGKPIAGFTAADFDVFSGDSRGHKLSWRGRSDLGELAGRRLMLRLTMFHAQLYSFTI